MNKSQYRDFRPLLFIFVFVTAFCLTGKDFLAKQGIQREVVIVGNFLLFAVSVVTWVIYRRSMQSTVHSRQSTVDSPQSTVDSRQSTVGSPQSTVDSQQSTVNSPQAAVRAMYMSFMMKFFVLAIAAFVYIMVAKKNVNTSGLIVCAGLYILYTFFETRALMRMARQAKHG